MNEIRKKEVELLAKLTYENDVPLKLAKDLLKTAEKLSYENHNNRGRVKEYQDLILFHANKL